jgi:hypothetical protein
MDPTAKIGHPRRMERSAGARRVVLVPRTEREAPSVPGIARLRRFGLARVSVSPRSALGIDRHERLERVADLDGGSASASP